MHISEEDEARMDHSADILKDFLQEQIDLLEEAREEDDWNVLSEAIGRCKTMLMIVEHT